MFQHKYPPPRNIFPQTLAWKCALWTISPSHSQKKTHTARKTENKGNRQLYSINTLTLKYALHGFDKLFNFLEKAQVPRKIGQQFVLIGVIPHLTQFRRKKIVLTWTQQQHYIHSIFLSEERDYQITHNKLNTFT